MRFNRTLGATLLASAAIVSAQCGGNSPSSPSARLSSVDAPIAASDRVSSTRAAGDATNNVPELSKIKVCKAGDGSGSFTVAGGNAEVATVSPTIATGNCVIVAESSVAGGVGPASPGASITITESPSVNLQSVSILRNDAGALSGPFVGANGLTLFLNNYHGFVITFTNDIPDPPAQLAIVKTPDGGVFTSGSQVSFTIVVSNPAPAGGLATGPVTLTDALPGAGGLVWATATTSAGSCVSPIVANTLNCSLGSIAAGGSVTVTVTSTATTPAAACQSQPNPAATATAGALTASDSGSLTCTPPPTGNEGCTPGYWKQDQHLDSWVGTGYAPNQDFDTVFGVNFFNPNQTLVQAAGANGGGTDALARHAVAALLNSASADVDYPYTTAQVLDIVQGDGAYAGLSVEARKNLLAAANELGCDLN